MHFHSSASACCRSGSVQKAGGMCCPRRSGGCPRSGPQKGLGMLSWGSGEQSRGSFWVTVLTNCSRNCYTRCCLKESYFQSHEHVPDFYKPSAQVKNFQVVGFRVRGGKGRRKIWSRSWKSCVSWALVGGSLQPEWRIRREVLSAWHTDDKASFKQKLWLHSR